ncbi:DUF3363 domain-containing protein [Acidithiobacillus sulfuriphilus]|uniref:DUF3363 domain-containing protein n=1 Tax=Acidithiobacillus sulfuriphilus TaxID=1867749 RepID=UPI003F641C8C
MSAKSKPAQTPGRAQTRSGRFLSSTETLDDQLSPDRAPGGRNRAVASRVNNNVLRARSRGSGAARSLIKSLLPHVGNGTYKSPTSRGPALRASARRCTVKVSYVRNKGPGQWRAHGKYLSREGAQVEGEKGQGFDRDSEAISLSRRLEAWQEANDPHLFKVILAPEDPLGPEALRDLTRRFNARIQAQVGRDYEWAAIDHHNTSHPHVHLLIRGKDKLELEPDLIRRGMREAAQEILTERLGYRTERDIRAAREREIEQRRFTTLDRVIQEKAAPAPQGYALVDETPPARLRDQERENRRLRLARLEKLTEIGVADKIGPNLWRLEPGWDRALRELQVLQTRTKMLAEARALMTEPCCPPQVTRLKPGDRLVGRVLGTGLDEQFDRSFVLIEGVDNRAHIVYQTGAIERARSEQRLGLRHLVALTALDRGMTTKDYGIEIPDQGWKQVKIPPEVLDDHLHHEERHPPKEVQDPATGFAAEWHRRLLERRKEREKQKVAERQKQQRKTRGKTRKSDEIE